MKVRKQVYELIAADFDASPVWEFASDEEGEEGQDEATVWPFEFDGTLDPSEGMFVVRAAFTLADGTEMTGYLTPPVGGDGSLGTLQPIVLTSRGQVGFWHGLAAPGPDVLQGHYQRLGKDESKTFPVRFSSAVELAGRPIEGVLGGFLYIKKLGGPAFEVK